MVLPRQAGPTRLSIVVIFHNMVREAPRTLHSLSRSHQRDLAADDYEVIAIDNASTQPLDPDMVTDIGPNFRYHFFETESPSPVDAVNFGAAQATGSFLAVIVDGARMASPGLVGRTQRALDLHRTPFVCALSWHLGPDVQRRSMLEGYDQAEEDRLLTSINWPADGYRLFEISTLAPSSRVGFLGGMPVECSWWAMPSADFARLGGLDARFQSPGGGLVNHDFRERALALDGVRPIVLLGEGVFHQFHGGVSTNATPTANPNAGFRDEFERIRGHRHTATAVSADYYGSMPEAARRFVG